jgi:ubiquinone/menaquinone biosynthesis C-methylase UbiE
MNKISFNQTERSKTYLLSKMIRGSSVLEVGCGNGEFSIACAKKGMNAVGLDVSQKMIENAVTRSTNLNIKDIKFINQDFLKFKTKAKFDYLVFCYFLNIFPNEQVVETVIKKGISNLKPSGIILIADEFEPHNRLLKFLTNIMRIPVFAFFKMFAGVKYHKTHDLRKILKNLNINIIEEKRFLFQYCSILIGKL